MLLPFFWGRVPLLQKKKGTLILTSLPEDLDFLGAEVPNLWECRVVHLPIFDFDRRPQGDGCWSNFVQTHLTSSLSGGR